MTQMLWPHRNLLVLSEKTLRVAAFLLVPLLLGAVALGQPPAQASPRIVTFGVDSTLDEPDATPGDGSCASTPSGLCTLRAAVQEANALAGSDTIALPVGVYTLTVSGRGEDLCATGDLDILESVTIQGAGTATTIIDANSLDRAFQVFSPAAVTISELTVQAGDSGPGLGASGGGIAMASGSTLTLEDAALSGNTAGDAGGGIYSNGGELILRRTRVVANKAATAAGIRNAGSLSVYDSTIADNQATQYGGGILNTGALTLEGVTVSGNTANTNAGGLYLHSADPAMGQVTISNSTISGNQAKAYMGGGIWVYYQTELWLTNSTIAGNSAGQGGGIFNYHQQAARASGGRSMSDNVAQAGNIHLQNTIVANNTIANCGRSTQTEPIHSLGHNLDSGTTCEFAAPGDLVGTNPQLGLLQDNGGPTWTRALLPGSPAIDAGDNVNCPATDQRGVSRPQGGTCDIGAYESVPTGEANLGIGKRDDPDPVEPGAPLTYTLSITNTGPYEATAVEVVDTLPTGVGFADASGSGWSCGHAGGEVTCTRPALAIGSAPGILIHLLAPSSTGPITNTVSVTSAVADPSHGNNAASEHTLVEAPPLEGADLSIDKTGSPNPVKVGDLLTYTLMVANAGPDTATAVAVTDQLPPEVTYSDASGAGWSCGHDEGTVTCTTPSLAVAVAPDIVISVTAPGHTGTITNTATVSSQVVDPKPNNNSARVTIQVRLFHYVYLPLVLR